MDANLHSSNILLRCDRATAESELATGTSNVIEYLYTLETVQPSPTHSQSMQSLTTH